MPVDVDVAREAIQRLLLALGVDPSLHSLDGTPDRVARSWVEMLEGYEQDPSAVLRTTEGGDGFATHYDQMVCVTGIEFTSTCEHHLLPFFGVADVAYIPGASGKVCGLSKLPRLVHVFARRLQMQERLTQQVAEALEQTLVPLGVGVRIRSEHSCVRCRGVRQTVSMRTEALLGVFREHPVRDEFWSLCRDTA